MNASGTATHDLEWDEDQLAVIQADAGARLIVEAGPGTGKTAVACARLAHLISVADVEPSNTWMISFTRTAVAEIRARLHSYVGDASFAIRIATVDSHAWSIHSGHDASARLTGSYEENIQRVIDLLKMDKDVLEELSRVEHVVIDEAQDLVGLRADLVSAMLVRLSVDCGITVFADEAQAIYGFSDDSAGAPRQAPSRIVESLLDRLRRENEPKFTTLVLREVHRTSSPGLRRIFSEVRRDVLAARNVRSGVHAEVAERVRELADDAGLQWRDMKVSNFTADDLLLFRTRAEVLMASQFCDIPHRLRLSGFGATLPSWLALCFFDFVDLFLSEQVFLDRWSARVENQVTPEYGPGEAWNRLLRVGGSRDQSIDMRKLRRKLSQSRPPVELSTAEYGLRGPIVGTIHASKGREASKVTLILPHYASFGSVEEEAEETRVLFVGATRARNSLIVGEGNATRAATLSSGRTYGWTLKGKTMVEIGRDGDISASGLVGRSEFSQEDSHKAQGVLARVSDVVTTYSLQADCQLDWRYRVLADDGEACVAVLTKSVGYDHWEILRNRGHGKSHKPPMWLNHVRAQGCASLVVAADANEVTLLHEPWASSGFILAPRIAAYPSFYYKKS